MKPLLSPSQLGAIQRMAESGMQVEVIVKRPVFVSDEDGDGGYDTSPDVVSQPVSVLREGKLFGYLRQTGGDTTGGFDTGALVTTGLFNLGLPVGTDIVARDIAVIRDREYRVQDVMDDETWPAMLDVTLRHRE